MSYHLVKDNQVLIYEAQSNANHAKKICERFDARVSYIEKIFEPYMTQIKANPTHKHLFDYIHYILQNMSEFKDECNGHLLNVKRLVSEGADYETIQKAKWFSLYSSTSVDNSADCLRLPFYTCWTIAKELGIYELDNHIFNINSVPSMWKNH